MNRQSSLALTRRLIDRITTDTTDESAEPQTEAASIFLDQDLWLREQEQFFYKTPQVVAFAGELSQPNSYLCTEVLDVPVVVTRAEDGELRAFINACGHRGARVASGSGVRKRLTCSFHGWSYQLNGSLGGRPKEDAFNAIDEQAGLVELPVSDRSGLVVVGIRPDVDKNRVDHALDELIPAFEGFAFDKVHTVATGRLEVDANWKLVTNLSHESYHFSTLHRDSLAPFMTSHAVVDTFGPHSRWAFPMKGLEALADVDESQWPDRPAFTMNHTVFPGTVIVVSQRDAQMIRVEPGRHPGHSVIHYSGVCDDPATIEESRKAYEFGGKIFETEDLLAAAQCQQGLAAGQPTIVVGRNEPVVQFWHRLWRELLSS